MKLRTVTCEITLVGTPAWVEKTLQHSAVLPTKAKVMPGCGSLRRECLSDSTIDLSEEAYEKAIGKLGGQPPDDGPYPDSRRRNG